jgi:hypothetical protein
MRGALKSWASTIPDQVCLAGVQWGVDAALNGAEPLPHVAETIYWTLRLFDDKDKHRPEFEGDGHCTTCPQLTPCIAFEISCMQGQGKFLADIPETLELRGIITCFNFTML